MRKSKKKPVRKSTRPKGTYPWLNGYPDGVKWDTRFKAEPLNAVLSRTIERHGDRICTHFVGKTITYGEIGNLVDRCAKGLQNIGVRKGTKVGLLLPNCPAYVIFYFGILKAGGIVVNCNPLYTVEELDHQIKDSETEIMVTLDLAVLFEKAEGLLARKALDKAVVCSFTDMLTPIKSMLFRILKSKTLARSFNSELKSRIISDREILGNDGRPEPVEIEPERDVAVLQYTGGTTGLPKAAMLTHANLTINIQQVEAWCADLLGEKERILAILPLFHVFAMTSVLNFGVARGYEIVLMPRFDIEEALKLIAKTQPTIFPGVPTIYNAILHHPKTKSLDLSSLKFCISGGAALPVEVKRGFEALSGCSLVEGYGLSETSPVATCNPPHDSAVEGSIGLPLPATVISIRSIDDPKKELPLGEDGEICIAGPQVMPGYWQKPEETKNTFTGEFFRSGDVGHMDENGFIFIVDRLKDMINAAGFKIYPRQIEEAIYEHEAVEEVTVIGIEDEYRGEVPAAYIKLREGHSATREDILEFLEPKISKIEMPRDIEFRDELPKTMIGKLSKKELREERSSAPNADE
ncbi:MAG: long-chain fatty acid--CoA ligase [Hyphomicrobiaceae bacterium]|nr:long-chain fatty acid--CoA ligase [Hyphomicrobiaceae bacterium]